MGRTGRRAALIFCGGLVLASCSQPATVLLTAVASSQVAPPSHLLLSIYDEGGVAVEDRRLPADGALGALPETVVLYPPAGRELLRLHLRGMSGSSWVGEAARRVPLTAGRQVEVTMVLDDKRLDDGDGDGVPDVIDACPEVPDEQVPGACPGLEGGGERDAGEDSSGDAPADGPGDLDGAGEGAPPDATDLGADVTLDATPDQQPDGGPGPLVCGPAVLIPSAVELTEPALMVDGLTLVARKHGTANLYSAERTAPGLDFGGWSSYDGFPFPSEDQAYFDYKGAQRSISADNTASERVLRYCVVVPATQSGDCALITLEEDGAPIGGTVDFDGPDVVDLGGGTLLMAVNISKNGGPGEQYLAVPQGSDLLTWDVTFLDAVNLPGKSDDDGTLSADGRVLVFASNRNNFKLDLWVAYRDSTSEPFGAPVELSDLNTVDNEKGPLLRQLGGPDDFELFFSSDRGDEMYIYRAVCAR